MEDILDSLRSEREREIYLQRSDENKIGERPGAELKHIEREREIFLRIYDESELVQER